MVLIIYGVFVLVLTIDLVWTDGMSKVYGHYLPHFAYKLRKCIFVMTFALLTVES